MKKATLEDLLARKQADKLTTKDVDVPALGLKLTIVKQPLSKVLAIMDSYQATPGLASNFEMTKELIYLSVPLFQDKKLQATFEVAEPYDIVPAVFNDNLQAIGELGGQIIEMYGLNNAIAEIKN